MDGRMPKSWSYLRFSTPDQALGASRRRQLEANRAYCAEHGLTLVGEMADEGFSGFFGANRIKGEFGEFLRLVVGGKIERGSWLLVEALDRISRENPVRAQNTLTSIILAGIIVVTMADKQIYSELGFGHLCGIGSGIYQRVDCCAWHFDDVQIGYGGFEILASP
jgi:DNA invertase Pin-like site-specific DNA recombinase